jgi:hypothetical protein
VGERTCVRPLEDVQLVGRLHHALRRQLPAGSRGPTGGSPRRGRRRRRRGRAPRRRPGSLVPSVAGGIHVGFDPPIYGKPRFARNLILLVKSRGRRRRKSGPARRRAARSAARSRGRSGAAAAAWRLRKRKVGTKTKTKTRRRGLGQKSSNRQEGRALDWMDLDRCWVLLFHS